MHPSHPTRLTLLPPVLNADTQSIRFAYIHSFSERPDERYEETLTLPAALWNEQRLSSPASERLLVHLSLALSLSYWKMYCPSEVLPYTALTPTEAALWNTLYGDAMGEFLFRNQIDPSIRTPFAGTAHHQSQPRPMMRDFAIVPFGGGKDSLLTLQLLQQSGTPFEPFTLGSSVVQEQSLARLELQACTIKRTLDPEMIRKSKSGEAYNGHVSITLIYALSAALVALLRDARWAVFSNEWSASEATTVWNGRAINHQWSKSLEAERLIRELIHTSVAPDLTVFSLLRPLTEVGIIARVACELQPLFGSFSSCNRNFVIASDRPHRADAAYWCGTCPKCAFVGLVFAVFIDKQALIHLLGTNPLEQAELLPLYEELLGRTSHKPFECVGTMEETAACLKALARHPQYQNDVIVRTLSPLLPTSIPSIDELRHPIAEAVQELPSSFQSLYDHR